MVTSTKEGLMKFFYLGFLSLCFFLASCDKPKDEMEDLDLMVQLDEDEGLEWSLPESRMLGQETPVYEVPVEEAR